MNKQARLAVVLVGTFILVVLVAVAWKAVDQDPLTHSGAVEANLRSYFEERLSRPVDDVDCLGDRNLQDGDNITCKVVLDGTAVEVNVTVSGSPGDVTYYPDISD